MDGMIDIGRRKFGWMTTNGLLKVKTLFGVKSKDGGCMKASCGCNEVGRMAGIKPKDDVVLLSGSHDDNG